MDRKIKKIVWLLIIYILALLIGFRSGEIYTRVESRIEIEKVKSPEQPPPKYFYIVEKHPTSVNFREVSEDDVIIKLLFNEKLKPLLKLRDLEIYTSKGERIY